VSFTYFCTSLLTIANCGNPFADIISYMSYISQVSYGAL